MAAMEGIQDQSQQQQQQAAPPKPAAERLNPAVQQQLNLESVKTRAISLYKAISRILEDIDAVARANAVPKWFHFLLPHLQFRMWIWIFFIFWIWDGVR